MEGKWLSLLNSTHGRIENSKHDLLDYTDKLLECLENILPDITNCNIEKEYCEIIKLRTKNKWLVYRADFNNSDKNIIKKYNKHCEKVILGSFWYAIKDFKNRERSFKNYALYFYGKGNNYKSNFCDLFKYFMFYIHKKTNRFEDNVELESPYENYKKLALYFYEQNISNFKDTDLKNIIEGINYTFRELYKNSDRRNDETLVIFAANYSVKSTYDILNQIGRSPTK